MLDEIDAALDAVNVQKVANYIVKSSRDFQVQSSEMFRCNAQLFMTSRFSPTQCIVISLKDAFYSKVKKICMPTSQTLFVANRGFLCLQADGIVGIYRDKKAGSSRTLTVDLRNFVDA